MKVSVQARDLGKLEQVETIYSNLTEYKAERGDCTSAFWKFRKFNVLDKRQKFQLEGSPFQISRIQLFTVALIEIHKKYSKKWDRVSGYKIRG